jgi:Raf kinase inhibitor-like YbhB/YbcL family protein
MILIISPACENGGKLPRKYTCDGENVNPPLIFRNLPAETESLVLILEDLDAHFGVYNHWIVWNISPEIAKIEENSLPPGAVLGTNSFGNNYYEGPCPRVPNTHRYLFTVYALNAKLEIKTPAKRADLEEVITNHILDEGKLMVMYSRGKLPVSIF